MKHTESLGTRLQFLPSNPPITNHLLACVARLHGKLKEDDDAAKLYMRFVAQAEMSGVGVHLPEEQGHAHLYLAHYHMKKRSFGEAEAHAHKCREFVAVSITNNNAFQHNSIASTIS